MSDYLTNLVARSREQTPAIRPRLTSLFEPVRGSNTFFPEPELIAEGFESVIVGAPAARDELQIPPANTPAAETPAAEPLGLPRPAFESRTTEDSVPPVNRVSRPSEVKPQTISPVVQPKAEERPTLAAREPEIATPPQTLFVKAAVATPHPEIVLPLIESAEKREIFRQETPIETKNELPTDLPMRDRAVIPVSSQITRYDEATLPGEPVKPNVRKPLSAARVDDDRNANTVQAPRDEMPRPAARLIVPRVRLERNRSASPREPSSIIAEQILPSSTRQPRSRADASLPADSRVPLSEPSPDEKTHSESAAPVINVTIGRVEVRAVPVSAPQSKSQKSTAASKLMSLDDYLRQRAQGGSR